jgi:hypothetical protein
MNKALKIVLAISFTIIIIVVLFAFSGLTLSPQNQNIKPIATQIPQATPSSGPFVAVDYNAVGWFYSINSVQDTSYNYTYLVLNITITNHQYSEININQSNGFTVKIDDKEYKPSVAPPLFIFNGTESSDYYSYPSTLPYNTVLLDNESVNGYVVFEFGDSTLIPPPIINVPFTLQYSVTFGNQTNSAPKATVVVNQIS